MFSKPHQLHLSFLLYLNFLGTKRNYIKQQSGICMYVCNSYICMQVHTYIGRMNVYVGKCERTETNRTQTVFSSLTQSHTTRDEQRINWQRMSYCCQYCCCYRCRRRCCATPVTRGSPRSLLPPIRPSRNFDANKRIGPANGLSQYSFLQSVLIDCLHGSIHDASQQWPN